MNSLQNAVNGGRRLNAFAKSLARGEMWHPSGGKSGTTFYKTKDDRLVVNPYSFWFSTVMYDDRTEIGVHGSANVTPRLD